MNVGGRGRPPVTSCQSRVASGARKKVIDPLAGLSEEEIIRQAEAMGGPTGPEYRVLETGRDEMTYASFQR